MNDNEEMPMGGKMGMGHGPKMRGGMRRKTNAMGRVTDEVYLPSFEAPDGLELSGESGTAEVDWKMTPDGRIEITAINGVSLEGESSNEQEANNEGDEYA